MSEAIAVALINNAGTLVSVLVTALTLLWASTKFYNYQRLLADYENSLNDIEFLLAVEREHCQINKEMTGGSNKRLVRSIASHQHEWSFEHSPSRIRRRKTSIDKQRRTVTQRFRSLGFRW